MEVFQLINEEGRGEVEYHHLTIPDEMIDNEQSIGLIPIFPLLPAFICKCTCACSYIQFKHITCVGWYFYRHSQDTDQFYQKDSSALLIPPTTTPSLFP